MVDINKVQGKGAKLLVALKDGKISKEEEQALKTAKFTNTDIALFQNSQTLISIEDARRFGLNLSLLDLSDKGMIAGNKKGDGKYTVAELIYTAQVIDEVAETFGQDYEKLFDGYNAENASYKDVNLEAVKGAVRQLAQNKWETSRINTALINSRQGIMNLGSKATIDQVYGLLNPALGSGGDVGPVVDDDEILTDKGFRTIYRQNGSRVDSPEQRKNYARGYLQTLLSEGKYDKAQRALQIMSDPVFSGGDRAEGYYYIPGVKYDSGINHDFAVAYTNKYEKSNNKRDFDAALEYANATNEQKEQDLNRLFQVCLKNNGIDNAVNVAGAMGSEKDEYLKKIIVHCLGKKDNQKAIDITAMLAPGNLDALLPGSNEVILGAITKGFVLEKKYGEAEKAWNKILDPRLKAEVLVKSGLLDYYKVTNPTKAIELCLLLPKEHGLSLIHKQNNNEQEGVVDKIIIPEKKAELIESLRSKKFGDNETAYGEKEALELAQIYEADPTKQAVALKYYLEVLHLKAGDSKSTVLQETDFKKILGILEKMAHPDSRLSKLEADEKKTVEELKDVIVTHKISVANLLNVTIYPLPDGRSRKITVDRLIQTHKLYDYNSLMRGIDRILSGRPSSPASNPVAENGGGATPRSGSGRRGTDPAITSAP